MQNKSKALAQAGFFYTKLNDVVERYECRVRIGFWQKSYRPFDIHRQKSPLCRLVQVFYHNRQTKLLNETITNTTHKLKVPHYFQAIHRLQHYLSHPDVELQNIHIDFEASRMWELMIPQVIKQLYITLRGEVIRSKQQVLIINDTPLHPHHSAFDWFRRVSQIRRKPGHTSLHPIQYQQQLVQEWTIMQDNERKLYTKLATIDKKRFMAEQLEKHLYASNLLIGLDHDEFV